MKKVLLTGASGFMGQELVPKLVKKYKLFCFVRKTSNLEKLKNHKISFVYGDILDRNSVFQATKNKDIIIHLATSHTSGNEELNIEGSKNIIDACEKNKVKRLVFISSMSSKRKILDNYGKAKLKIEKMIESSNLDYTIIRPSMIYTNHGISLIETNLKSVPFIIPIIGNGRYKMNPVHIKNVIEAITLSLNNQKSIKKSYDLAGSEDITFNEIISICKKQFKINKLIIHIPIFFCIFIFRLVPLISIEAIKGINENTNANSEEISKDLKIKLISFREGIKNVNI